MGCHSELELEFVSRVVESRSVTPLEQPQYWAALVDLAALVAHVHRENPVRPATRARLAAPEGLVCQCLPVGRFPQQVRARLEVLPILSVLSDRAVHGPLEYPENQQTPVVPEALTSCIPERRP